MNEKEESTKKQEDSTQFNEKSFKHELIKINQKINTIVILFFIVSLSWGGVMTGLYVTKDEETESSWDIESSLPLTEKMALYYHCCRMWEYGSQTINNMLSFAEKLILHSSFQYSHFTKTDKIFDENNVWLYGNSMQENWNAIENIFCVPQVSSRNTSDPYLTVWSGDKTIQEIFDWIKRSISYTSDDITDYGNDNHFDLFLSPIETLTRRKGDCEDFAILSSTIFENNGYETIFALINDDNYSYIEDGLHHALIFIKLDNPELFTEDELWYYAGEEKEWYPIDIVWTDEPFEEIPYIQYYIESSIKTNKCFRTWEDILDIIEID